VGDYLGFSDHNLEKTLGDKRFAGFPADRPSGASVQGPPKQPAKDQRTNSPDSDHLV
jgi:hypothetical protein